VRSWRLAQTTGADAVITFFGMEKVKFIHQKKGAVMSAVGHELDLTASRLGQVYL